MSNLGKEIKKAIDFAESENLLYINVSTDVLKQIYNLIENLRKTNKELYEFELKYRHQKQVLQELLEEE